MDIPNLPTDNLYKFIALSGVALVIACLYLATDANKQSAQELLTIQRDLATEKNSIQQMSALLERIENGETPPSDLSEKIATLAASAADLDIRSKYTSGVIHARRTLVLLLSGFVVSGIGLALGGFLLWYFKAQRYQDAILEAELLKLKREVTRPAR